MQTIDVTEEHVRQILKDLVFRALWFPLFVFLLHVFLSQVLRAYQKFPVLGSPMHLLGGIAITFFFSRVLTILQKSGLAGELDRRIRTMLLFALTATAAVFWEFGEFLVDHFFGTRMQLGLEDTLLDMFLGIVGGVSYLSAGLLVSSAGRNKRIART